KNLKEISLDREDLVNERVRLKNQLHTILHRIWNTEYRGKFTDPFSLKALRYWMRARPDCSDFLTRMMKRKVKRMLAIHEEIKELEAEMASLIEQSGHTVHTASGCGI